MTTKKQDKLLDLTTVSNPQSEVNSPRRTQYDANTAQEGAWDFVMRNFKETNEILNARHDLSKPKDGIILHCRMITQKQAEEFTDTAFIESITKSRNNKVWEFFCYVSELSDGLSLPLIEQVTVFHYLKKIDSASPVEYDKLTRNQGILADLYDPHERENFIKDVESLLYSQYRFYASGVNPGSGFRHCKVLFHDQKKLQFGKMFDVQDPIHFKLTGTITEQARRAKKSLKNMIPANVLKDREAKQKKRLEEERAAGPGLVPGSGFGEMAFRPQNTDTASSTFGAGTITYD